MHMYRNVAIKIIGYMCMLRNTASAFEHLLQLLSS